MDIQKTISEFHRFPREEKKILCEEVLSGVRSRGWLFEELWNLIQFNSILDEDLDNIYESAITVLMSAENAKIHASLDRLAEVRERLLIHREYEAQERISDLLDAEEVVSPHFYP